MGLPQRAVGVVCRIGQRSEEQARVEVEYILLHGCEGEARDVLAGGIGLDAYSREVHIIAPVVLVLLNGLAFDTLHHHTQAVTAGRDVGESNTGDQPHPSL